MYAAHKTGMIPDSRLSINYGTSVISRDQRLAAHFNAVEHRWGAPGFFASDEERQTISRLSQRRHR